MKTNSHKANWWIDLILFAGFLVAFMLDLTGLSLHQWLGVAVGIIAGYHLLAHWSWVKSVTQRIGRTSKRAGLYYVVDAGMLLGFTGILVTGLVTSTWLSIPLDNYSTWRDIHVDVSIVTLLLILIKIGVHWRWIVSITRRYIIQYDSNERNRGSIQPVPVNTRIDRRDFLKLMGLVGAASFIPLTSALDIKSGNPANDSETGNGQVSTQGTNDSENLVDSNGTSNNCVVRCNRGCSYPGHCRRFTDVNSNNRCDLGECI